MARDGAKDKPGQAPPAVSVLVVAYESGPHLGQCLAALAAQTFTDFEIILVDNASTDGAPQSAAADHPTVRLIAAGSNLGFAAANNLAAHQARGWWLALLNPDAFAHSDWLEQLVAATKTYAPVRCFGSRQLMDDDTGRLDGLGDVMSLCGFPFRGGYGAPDPGSTPVGETFSACGGAMLIEQALFTRLGGFDERLFCYGEDVDLGYRMRLMGEPSLVIPQAVVTHVGSASSGGARSEFSVFHGTRNRLWVYVKDTPPVLLWLTLPLHILATIVLFARHAMRGEFGPPWRGLMAGMSGLNVALAGRREAQTGRTIGSWGIAKAMTWDPLDLLLRRVVIRPLRPNRSAEP